MKFRHIAILSFLTILAVVFAGCMRWDYGDEETFDSPDGGLFIINEGNYMYGNASLSFYNPAERTIENEIFYRANGMRLGDVAQSMSIYAGKGWIVVNNSHVIFAIGLDDYRERGRIEGLQSPRYIHFVNDHKAYVTQLWSNLIMIVDPSTYQISGYIEVPGMDAATGSTEQIVQIGDYAYVTCWSYQTDLLKIDTRSDRIVGRVNLGMQPKALVTDRYGRLWTYTDGSDTENASASEAPALICVDPESLTILKRFRMRRGDIVAGLAINGTGDRIYWINDHVWSMSVTSDRLPVRPFIESQGTIYYALTADPVSDELYVADAIDYRQAGIIYRYSDTGTLIDKFYAGITPGEFCWKK